MAKIAMIIPYFGKFPEWMNLYLYTVSRNPGIDFHYFTDCEANTPPLKFATNIFFHRITFQEYREFIFEKTGIHLPDNPMKLCDLKPFYGIIHKEMLLSNDYEWWGFGDLDVVYGDLTPIIDKTKDNKYDIITTQLIHTAGHFTLFRIDSKFSDIAVHINGIHKTIENPENKWVDETTFSLSVRSRKIKFIDKLWYLIGKRFNVNRNRFYHIIDTILPGNSRQYYHEYGTSFKPLIGETYILDLATSDWRLGNAIFQDGIRPADNLPYLHFVWFKGRYGEDLSWNNDFWKISSTYHWRGDEKVSFSLSEVKLV